METEQTAGDDHAPEPLDADRLTWAVLLGRWVDFARSAVALPDDDQGKRMRDSVADIIMLQAVWFALHHLHELAPAERALGLDRAGVLIDRHGDALRTRWRQELPGALEELVTDAAAKLEAVQPPPS